MRMFSTHVTLIGLALMMLGAITLFSDSVFAERTAFNGPVNVIFDTDLCLDDDDGMALAIVHALHDRHEANLLAVTVGVDEKWCAPYASIINTFYGHSDVPIGTIRNGLRLNAEDDTFVQHILKRKNPDGSPIYPHHLKDGSHAPEAVSMLRKTLADQTDESVVMIQVGNSANFAASVLRFWAISCSPIRQRRSALLTPGINNAQFRRTFNQPYRIAPRDCPHRPRRTVIS